MKTELKSENLYLHDFSDTTNTEEEGRGMKAFFSSARNVLVILNDYKQWAPYYRSDSVVTADHYLQNEQFSSVPHLVLNLCSDLSYLSEGYYCSLLAQARRHKVLPSIETLNKLDSGMTTRIDPLLLRNCSCCSTLEEKDSGDEYILNLYFGRPEDQTFSKLGRAIFEQYPAPLLEVTISRTLPHQVKRIRPLSLEELSDAQQDLFADSLDKFSKKIWRAPKGRKTSCYDLAIFHDPEETLQPSDKKALSHFLAEAKKMDINAELLTEEDSGRLLEFDALFIRKTTSVDNITYRLATMAEQADMIVIDDPQSIICCTNKVYLKELLERKNIPIPRSKLLFCKHPMPYDELAADLGAHMVLKIPDGSFSVGVSKVESEKEYLQTIAELSKRSSVLLVQEFMPTAYDWRIGVLNGEAIFACKYYMARGHWQIYQHMPNGASRAGKWETLPVHMVPRRIVKLAEKATGTIGKGLYGVDMKETEKGPVVIEINDNPNIDHGVEDMILGAELYRIILREFAERLDAKRKR